MVMLETLRIMFCLHPRILEHLLEHSLLTAVNLFGTFPRDIFCPGPIPKELGALSKLETLALINNKLTGEKTGSVLLWILEDVSHPRVGGIHPQPET